MHMFAIGMCLLTPYPLDDNVSMLCSLLLVLPRGRSRLMRSLGFHRKALPGADYLPILPPNCGFFFVVAAPLWLKNWLPKVGGSPALSLSWQEINRSAGSSGQTLPRLNCCVRGVSVWDF